MGAVLITGGAGFVGLNLAERLLSAGESVVLFDRRAPPEAAHRLLGQLPGSLACVQGDVTEATELDALLANWPIDRVVHGAAITADVTRERRAAREILSVNVLGTVEVLEAVLRQPRVRRVVQLGTGSIFGAAGLWSDALDEQSSAVFPDTLYGISKFAAERVAVRYRHTRGVALTVVRLGMVFGRWEHDTGVRDTLSLALQLQRAAERGQGVVVHADAADDWVYSVDVAEGLASVLAMASTPEPVYHLSAGTRWSVSDWCERLARAYPAFTWGLSQTAEACTIGRGKVARRAPMRIDRLRRDAAYSPRFGPEAALADLIDWRTRARASGWTLD